MRRLVFAAFAPRRLAGLEPCAAAPVQPRLDDFVPAYRGTCLCPGLARARVEARVAREEGWQRMRDLDVVPGSAGAQSVEATGSEALPPGCPA